MSPVDPKGGLLAEIASLRAERDEARAALAAMTEALERTERNLRLAILGKPVRDYAENLGENDRARGLTHGD